MKEFYKNGKNSSSSNGSNDSIKRQRDENIPPNEYSDPDDDFPKSTARSKKRAAKIQNQNAEVPALKEVDYTECLDDEDFDDFSYNFEINGSTMKP